METVKIYSYFDRPGRSAIDCAGVSKVQQQFKDECDINNVMSKYKRTGVMRTTVGRGGRAHFGDFRDVTDYKSALEAVISADERFQGLPARLRERFGNNPGKFLNFVNNEENRDEAVKLGLIPKKEKKRPVPEPSPEAKVKPSEPPKGGEEGA